MRTLRSITTIGLIIFLLRALACSSSMRVLHSAAQYDSSHIVSVVFTARKDRPYTTEQVLVTNHGYKATISDSIFLNFIQKKLYHLEPNIRPHSDLIDCRIACVLYTGIFKDTIGLGWAGMQVNQSFFALDSTLLRAFAMKLPADHSAAIDKYFNVFYPTWRED